MMMFVRRYNNVNMKVKNYCCHYEKLHLTQLRSHGELGKQSLRETLSVLANIFLHFHLIPQCFTYLASLQ